MSGHNDGHALDRRGPRAPSSAAARPLGTPRRSRSPTPTAASSPRTSPPPHDVPPFDNSAMDGFAVRGAGPAFCGRRRIAAPGAPFDAEIGEGEAVAISTGAAVPAGTFAVVPVERVTKRLE